MLPRTGRPGDHAAADAAIERVLEAERAARAAIERTRAEVHAIGEAARRAAAALADRTERRCRAVAACHERDLLARLAGIEARQLELTRPHAITAAETALLDRAVRDLAAELSGEGR